MSQSVKQTEFCEMTFLEPELERGGQHSKSISAASPEINGRGIWKILGRTGDFTDVKIRVNDLRKHLVVKHKIIGILHKGNPLEHLP